MLLPHNHSAIEIRWTHWDQMNQVNTLVVERDKKNTLDIDWCLGWTKNVFNQRKLNNRNRYPTFAQWFNSENIQPINYDWFRESRWPQSLLLHRTKPHNPCFIYILIYTYTHTHHLTCIYVDSLQYWGDHQDWKNTIHPTKEQITPQHRPRNTNVITAN